MKKNLKLVLGCILSTLILCGCSITGNLQGTTIEEIKDSSDESDWKVHYVHINIGSGKSSTKYYSNHEGEYIYDVDYHIATDVVPGKECPRISYRDAFAWADDLEVFFVLRNGDKKIVSNTYHADLPFGSALIELPDECIDGYYISEIWIKWID